MVDIIALRQEKRNRGIKIIQESIAKAFEDGKDINFDNLMLSSMSNIGISKQTAREYIELALFNLGIKRSDLIIKNG